jgi:hypothetical protein
VPVGAAPIHPPTNWPNPVSGGAIIVTAFDWPPATFFSSWAFDANARITPSSASSLRCWCAAH